MTAADVDLPKDKLMFFLGARASPRAAINEKTGEFQWKPSAHQGLGGAYQITANVTDDEATDAKTLTVTVTDRVIKGTLQDRSYWDQLKPTLEERDWVKEFLDGRQHRPVGQGDHESDVNRELEVTVLGARMGGRRLS